VFLQNALSGNSLGFAAAKSIVERFTYRTSCSCHDVKIGQGKVEVDVELGAGNAPEFPGGLSFSTTATSAERMHPTEDAASVKSGLQESMIVSSEFYPAD